MLFGLFNELVIAPFIQPSRSVSATPIILDTDGIAADGTSKVIIPKINVEIPVDYSLTSLAEDVVQKGLENGIIHYPTTSRPGQQGNAAYFGHSSNNIFNPGKYKFAFVLLNNLENGDMFYQTYEGKVYAYKVYEKRVVSPEDVSVLNAVNGKTATAALITCDPPGTTLKRLVVWGEQISPDPATNTPISRQTAVAAPAQNTALPGQPKSLWSRLTGWLF
jgi:LPXTG-site transpeptidase (sortase) family protein